MCFLKKDNHFTYWASIEIRFEIKNNRRKEERRENDESKEQSREENVSRTSRNETLDGSKKRDDGEEKEEEEDMSMSVIDEDERHPNRREKKRSRWDQKPRGKDRWVRTVLDWRSLFIFCKTIMLSIARSVPGLFWTSQRIQCRDKTWVSQCFRLGSLPF